MDWYERWLDRSLAELGANAKTTKREPTEVTFSIGGPTYEREANEFFYDDVVCEHGRQSALSTGRPAIVSQPMPRR